MSGMRTFAQDDGWDELQDYVGNGFRMEIKPEWILIISILD